MVIKVLEDFIDKNTNELIEKDKYYHYKDKDRALEIISAGYAKEIYVKKRPTQKAKENNNKNKEVVGD